MPDLAGQTFGVELEVVAVVTQEEKNRLNVVNYGEDLGYTEYDNLHWAVLLDTGAVLRARGFDVREVEIDPEIGPMLFYDNDYSKWAIKTDTSIDPARIRESQKADSTTDFFGLEFVSPILPCSQAGLTDLWTFMGPMNEVRLLLDDKSCGMHVHIGFGDRGFPIDTIKKFLCLMVVFEAQMQTWHPPHRQDSEWARTLSRVFDIPEKTRIGKVKDIKEIEGIIQLLYYTAAERQARNAAYTLRNYANNNPRTWTVEFRQHKCTSSGLVAARWVAFTSKLLQYSHESSWGTLIRLFIEHGNDSNFSVRDLQRVVGVETTYHVPPHDLHPLTEKSVESLIEDARPDWSELLS